MWSPEKRNSVAPARGIPRNAPDIDIIEEFPRQTSVGVNPDLFGLLYHTPLSFWKTSEPLTSLYLQYQVKPDFLTNSHTNGINTGVNEHTALKLVRMLIKVSFVLQIH